MADKPILAVKYIFNREDPILLEGILKDLYNYEDEDLKIPNGIAYSINVWHSGKLIYVQGSVKADIVHPCDRCLVPVTLHINGKVDAIYMKTNPNYEGKTLKFTIEEHSLEDMANLIYYDETKLDFSDRIAESVITEIPSKVLCKPDCEGLCPVCGANWNFQKCEHYGKTENHTIDPRFKILEKYKLKLGE